MTEQRYAILIASSQFEDDNLQKLKCPENDVDGLDRILKSKEYGNFSNTFPLKNSPIIGYRKRLIGSYKPQTKMI